MNKQDKVYIPLIGQIAGGTLAVSVLMLFGVLALETRDIPLNISLICAGTSIPFLCARLLILVLEEKTENVMMKAFVVLLVHSIGVLFAYIGLVCIFFHFSWLYGLWFVITSVVALVLTAFCVNNMTWKPDRKVGEKGKDRV